MSVVGSGSGSMDSAGRFYVFRDILYDAVAWNFLWWFVVSCFNVTFAVSHGCMALFPYHVLALCWLAAVWVCAHARLLHRCMRILVWCVGVPSPGLLVCKCGKCLVS